MFKRKLEPIEKEVEQGIELAIKQGNANKVDWIQISTLHEKIRDSPEGAKRANKILLKKLQSSHPVECNMALQIIDNLFNNCGIFFQNEFTSEDNQYFFNQVPELEGILEFGNRKFLLKCIHSWMKLRSIDEYTRTGLKAILKNMLNNELNPKKLQKYSVSSSSSGSSAKNREQIEALKRELPDFLYLVNLFKETVLNRDGADLTKDDFATELYQQVKVIKKCAKSALELQLDEVTMAALIELNEAIYQSIDLYKQATKELSKQQSRLKQSEMTLAEGKNRH